MKTKKLLVTLLVLTFILSSFSVGFAAEDNEVIRAQALGILKGDDQGNLNLDKPITRAEALALIVRISGLDKSAELMAGQTQFADVNVEPSLQWATGYINLGVGQGIVNGYPDGTFKGNNQVTNAEMAKMLLYAMNYGVTVEGGQWPAAVMGKADSLNIFKKVNVLPNIAAVRGDVVKMIDNSLSIKHLEQTGYGDLKSYVEGTKTFLTKMDVKELKEVVVTAVPKVDSKLKDYQIKVAGKTYKVIVDLDFDKLFGQEVKVLLNDDDEIISAEAKSNSLYDALKDITDKKVKLVDANEKYNFADKVTVFINSEAKELKDLAGKEFSYAKVVLDKYGDINFVDAYNLDDFIVVEKVDGNNVIGFGDEINAKDFTIVEEGETVALEDLEEGDILFYNSRAGKGFAEIYNRAVEGKIDRIYDNAIKVEGKEYKRDIAKYLNENDKIKSLSGSVLSTSAFKDIAEAMQKAGDVLVFLNRKGDMIFLSGDIGKLKTSSEYVFLTADSKAFVDRSSKKWTYDILNAQGAEVKYDISDDDAVAKQKILKDINNNATTWSNNAHSVTTETKSDKIKKNMVTELKLNVDGKIDQVRLLNATTKDVQIKTSEKYFDGKRINSDAVVYLIEDYVKENGKVKDIVIKAYEDLDFDYFNKATFYDKDDKVVAIVVEKSSRKADDVTHFTVATADDYKVSGKDQYTLKLVLNGEKVSVDTVVGIENYVRVNKGDLLEVKVGKKTGDVNSVTKITEANRVVSGTVADLSTVDKSLKIGDTANIKLGVDGVVVDAEDSYKVISFSSLKNGDIVKALRIAAGSKYVDVIVKTGKVDTPTPTPTAGVVTYIDGLKVTAATDVVVTVTLPVENTDAYRVRVINATAGTAGAPSADFYGTKAFKASELEVDTAGTPTTLDATIGKDNKYNVIVEVKQADGTYKIVDNKIVETVDPAKTSLLSAKVKTAYVAPVNAFATVGNMKVEQLGAKAKIEIQTQTGANAALTFEENVAKDGYVIKLANDELGNVKTTWSELVNFINGNATLKALYKAELVGADAVATLVAEVDIPTDGTAATGETKMVVTLTFDKALKDNASAKVTIDGKDYTVNITGTPTTVDVTLGAGVETAAKVEKLDGFTNAAGTPAILPAGGVAITK